MKTVRITTKKIATTGNATSQPVSPVKAAISRVREAVRAATAPDPQPLPTDPPKLSISPAYLSSIDDVASARISDDKLQRSSRAFTSAEQLLGIAKDRPEIITLCQFLPFFSAAQRANHTPAAMFFDAQAQLRQLRAENIKRVGFEAKDALNDLIEAQRADFRNVIVELSKHAQFLLALARRVDGFSAQLDLRHDAHVVDAASALSRALKVAAPSSSDLGQKFSIIDVLTSFGFTSSNVSTLFSSTKLWMQLVYELKQGLMSHFPSMLDMSVAQYVVDRDPTTLTKLTSKRFAVNSKLVVPSISDVINVGSADFWTLMNGLTFAYENMYEDVTFSTDEQSVATICSEVSREFRYSSALQQPEFQAMLRTSFGYTSAVAGNRRMLDNVLGKFGIDAVDVPAERTGALTDVSISVIADEAVLTFENRYISGPNGTLTPGSAYYVDDVLAHGLKLEHERIKRLSATLGAASKGFNDFVNGANAFMTVAPSDRLYSAMNDPRALFDNLSQDLVDPITGSPRREIIADKLAFVFSTALQASTSARLLKSVLFTFCLLQAVGVSSSGNAQLTSLLLELITQCLESSLAATVDPPGDYVRLSADELKQSFTGATSEILYFIQKAFVRIHSTMSESDRVFINGRTRYGGHSDTVVMMIVFDMLLRMVSRCSGQAAVGHFFRNGSLHFVVRRTSASSRSFLAGVRSRIDDDSTTMKKCLLTVLNVLQRLKTGADDLIAHVSSQSTKVSAAAIVSILSDDSLLDVLNDKQQIMLLNAIVSDFTSNVDAISRVSSTRTLSIDSDDDFDDADMFQVLDDGVISDKLKRAVFGLLSEARFVPPQGENKKIVSVGIPIGFSDDLKKRSIMLSSRAQGIFAPKQLDVVNVCVYKIDMQHQDLIYAPQKFAFELSKFPVRASSMLPEYVSFDEYFGQFPLRDFSQQFEGRGITSAVQYLRPASPQQQAFSGASYDFLSGAQKAEIARNTTVSFLLETYIRLMTGLSVAEQDLSLLALEKMIDDDKLERLIVANLDAAARKSSSQGGSRANTFFVNAANADQRSSASVSSRTTLSSALGALTQRVLPVATQQLVTIDELTRMITPLVSRVKLLRRVLAPRAFERVFHVIVDPDEFALDRAKTTATSHGKDALSRALSSGDIIEDQAGNLRQRSRTLDDFSFEKYFATVETVDLPEPTASVFNGGFLSPKRRRS